MIRVQQDFQDRVDEIEAYIEFVGRIDSEDAQLLQADASTPAYSSNAKDDLLRTMRASAFLLLYNLMESTVTNAVEAIFDELETQRVDFDDCSERLRAIVLTNLKVCSVKDLLPNIQRLASDIISRTFRKNEVVSANVDARLIRDLADTYGFDAPEVPQVWQQAEARGFPTVLPSGQRLPATGGSLLTVKTHRNNLAHGSSSFSEVGKNFTHNDIVIIKCEVIAYLDTVLKNVSDYLKAQQYRR
jgi:hypothetical protein